MTWRPPCPCVSLSAGDLPRHQEGLPRKHCCDDLHQICQHCRAIPGSAGQVHQRSGQGSISVTAAGEQQTAQQRSSGGCGGAGLCRPMKPVFPADDSLALSSRSSRAREAIAPLPALYRASRGTIASPAVLLLVLSAKLLSTASLLH